jgi:uncharacterized delta-60 repeat protein
MRSRFNASPDVAAGSAQRPASANSRLRCPTPSHGAFIEAVESRLLLSATISNSFVIGPILPIHPFFGSISGTIFDDLLDDGLSALPLANAGANVPHQVYIDLNNDGAFDNGEPSATVDPSSGTFSFPGIVPGTYSVRQIIPAGWMQTAPSNPYIAVNEANPGTSSATLLNSSAPVVATVSLFATTTISFEDFRLSNLNPITVNEQNIAFPFSVTSMAEQQDGKLVVGGYQVNASTGNDESVLARYNADGSPDGTFGNNGEVLQAIPAATAQNDIRAIVIDPRTGEIVAAGDDDIESQFPSYCQGYVQGFLSSGRIDSNFFQPLAFLGDPVLETGVHAIGIALTPDGHFLVSGYTLNSKASVGNTIHAFAYELNENGTPNTSFGGAGTGESLFARASGSINRQAAVAPDGSYYFPTSALNSSSVFELAVEHFSANGIDEGEFSFNPGTVNETADVAAVQPDGRVIVAGTSNNGLVAARFNEDGSLDTSFGSPNPSNGQVAGESFLSFADASLDVPAAIALTANGDIVVGGLSTANHATTSTAEMAILNSGGQLDTSAPNGNLFSLGASTLFRNYSLFANLADLAGDVVLFTFQMPFGDIFNGIHQGTSTLEAAPSPPAEVPGQSTGSLNSPTPHISVAGDNTVISNGAATTSAQDGTSFGTAIAGSATISRTFTIENTGSGGLSLAGVSVPAGFTLVSPPPASIAAGGSANFIIGMSTTSAGSPGGTVSFGTNDPNTSIFSFAVSGMVSAAPASSIAVLAGGQQISNAQPSSVSFGSALVGTAALEGTFTVENNGTENLTLGSAMLPAGFSLASALPSPIAAGGSGSFTIDMSTASVGTPDGQFSFATNDPKNPTFSFGISGTVTAAPQAGVAVVDGQAGIANGQSNVVNFGTSLVGSTPAPTQTFTVENNGTANLTPGIVSVPAGFTLTSSLPGSIVPEGSASFTVRMSNASAGNPAGLITFTTNAPAAASFSFPIAGTVSAVASTPPPGQTPDLLITQITTQKIATSLVGGQKTSAGAALITLKNLSSGTLSGAATLRLFASPGSGSAAAGSLNLGQANAKVKLKPGQSQTVKVKIAFPPVSATGTFFIVAEITGAVVTSGDIVVGTAANRVTVLKPFVSLRGPNLGSPFSAAPGKVAMFNLPVSNTGDVTATGTANLDLLLSTDGTLSTATALTTLAVKLKINPNGQQSVKLKFTFPATASAGSSTLLVVLRANGPLAALNLLNGQVIASFPISVA